MAYVTRARSGLVNLSCLAMCVVNASENSTMSQGSSLQLADIPLNGPAYTHGLGILSLMALLQVVQKSTGI